MSYSVSVTHRSPDEALATLKADPGYQFVPQPVKDELEDAIDVYKEAGVKLIDVTCYGHHPRPAEKTAGCNASVHLSVTVLE